MIVGITKGSGVTGAMRYLKGEGRDELTGELKERVGDKSRAELLGGQGFGFEIKSEADAELARKIMEFAGKPENQASKTKPCRLDCEHITLSWATGQTPDNAEKLAAAHGVLEALGMVNARAVFYAHHDAAYAHIHIVASRIHPDTRRAYSAYEDIYKSQAWALKWEREHNQIVASRQWMHTLADAARRGDHVGLRAALTAKEATFSRKDVDRAFAWAGYFGEERAKPRDAFLAEREIVPLRQTADGPVKAYTTRGILAEERAIQRDARVLHERRGFGLKPETVAAAAIKYGLTREQAEALDHITRDNGFAMIAGQAGAGKTRVLMAARDAYRAEGFDVRGLAWTNKVVANMRRDGFESATITSELHRVERESGAWGPKTILIVDEAAQLSNKNLGELLRQVDACGAKISLTGDDRQLGSIERGGMFRPLRDEFGAAQLNMVQRVKDKEEQKAFGLMHGGTGERDFEGALRIFDEKGAIHWSRNRGEAIRDLGTKYIADVEAAPDKKRLILAQTNEEVKTLNEFARALHRERGELGEDQALPTAGGSKAFAAGDRVSITANSPTKAGKVAGLVNGSFGRILDIAIAPEGKREVTLELDGERGQAGPKFRFVVGDNRELGEFNGLNHGYASTVYKSQGDTLDQIYDLHSPAGRADSNYVAKTRHCEDYSLFVAKDRTKDFDELVRQTSHGQDKTAASIYRYDERDVAMKEAATEAGQRADKPQEPAAGKAADPVTPHVASDPLNPVPKRDGVHERATDQTEIPRNVGKVAPKQGSMDSVTPENKSGRKPNDTIEQSEVASDARDAARETANTQEKPERPVGQTTKRPALNIVGGASLPDPEAVARGGKLDQVHQLGKKPGKTAHRLREAFAGSRSGLDYMRALEAQGFHLAQIDGNDALESAQRREDAEAAKLSRKPRVFEQGELVAINRYGSAYRIDAYSTGAKRAEIDEKLGGIDRGTLPTLQSAYFKARIAAIEQTAPRGIDLDQWRKRVNAARTIEAAKERGKARGLASWNSTRKQAIKGIAAAAGGVGNLAAQLLGGLAPTIESMGLSEETRAELKAEDQAHREAAPCPRQLDQARRLEEAASAPRWENLATEFEKQLAADREPGLGREIGRNKGSGLQ